MKKAKGIIMTRQRYFLFRSCWCILAMMMMWVMTSFLLVVVHGFSMNSGVVVAPAAPAAVATTITARSSRTRNTGSAAAASPLFATTAETVTTEEDEETAMAAAAPNGLLKRDRYVATNRFAVRQGKAAKFEQRWATRKSKLATLPGFKYFHLMRRVTLNADDSSSGASTSATTTTYDEGTDDATAQGNMVSFTIWDKKSDFSAWRSGEAFKEAHGGTSIGAFLSTMVNSALVLRGAPRPAFYDGLLVQSIVPESVPETVDGWRKNVQADGVNTLPTECFIACNQFYVPRENAVAFEQQWANRESKLAECDGFVAFTMLRRDGQAKGHGTVEMDTSSEPTYMSTTIWKDRASFDAWKNGRAFQQAHSSTTTTGGSSGTKNKKKEEEEGGGGTGSGKVEQSSDKAEHQPPNNNTSTTPPPQPPLWSRPPQPVFYEGVLVISSEGGA